MSKIVARECQKIEYKSSWQAAGLPMPKVENFCGGVRVTFQRGLDVVTGKKIVPSDVPSDVPSNGGKVGGKDVGSSVSSLSVVHLTDRQKKIRELILNDAFISTQQMSVVLSVVKRTVERDLAAMQKMGILIREGNTSAGHWIVIEPHT